MYEIFLKLFDYKKFYFKIDVFNPLNTNTEMIKSKIKNNISLLVLVNPAHPFEKYWKINELEKILKFANQNKVFVIIDEVYQGIGTKSCIGLTKKFKNFVAIKSASKTFGLPGLRIGFAIGNKKTIKQIESFRLSHELPSDIIDKGVNVFKNYKKKIFPRIQKVIKARNFAIQEFRKRNKVINGGHGNSLSVFFKNRKKLIKLGNELKKKIIVNYNYPKPYENFLNITTTSKPNLKNFLKFLIKMTIINWDTRTHALNFNEEIKKVYENEIKNRKKFTSWIGKISEMHYKGNLDWHISTPASRNPL